MMEGTGYHIGVRHTPAGLITIHTSTDNLQHKPRDVRPASGFPVGPIDGEYAALRIARKLADELGYPVPYCKLCFRDRQTPSANGGGRPGR